MEECGPCPVFASFTLAFALQLRKKQGKTSVRVRKTSVRVQYASVRVQYDDDDDDDDVDNSVSCAWTGLNWLRIGISGGFLLTR